MSRRHYHRLLGVIPLFGLCFGSVVLAQTVDVTSAKYRRMCIVRLMPAR